MNEREKFEQILKEKGKLKPTNKELLLIKSKKKCQNMSKQIVETSKELWENYGKKQRFEYGSDYFDFVMLDTFYEDIEKNFSFFGDDYEWEWHDYMMGFGENENESVVHLYNYIFREYMVCNTMYMTLKNNVKEDFKHLFESKWNLQNLKRLYEVVHREFCIECLFYYRRKMFKYLLKTLLQCTSQELENKLSECENKKQWFIVDMYAYLASNKRQVGDIERDSLITWECTMYSSNPTRCFKKYDTNHILKMKNKIKKYAKKCYCDYNNTINQKYKNEELINVYNEFILMVEGENNYDKLCNMVFELMVKIINKGDNNTPKLLMELGDIYKMTRNNRRIKKQGSIGSLDMYNSRLGIEKTPQELHKLLF